MPARKIEALRWRRRGFGIQSPDLDDSREVPPEVKGAIGRGVNFDVGHEVWSFSCEVAHKTLAAGWTPGTISSDLHYYNVNGPVFDLPTTMSKFLRLDLGLDDTLMRTTTVPVRVLGLADQLAAPRPGFLAGLASYRRLPSAAEIAQAGSAARG
jgi:dihydroorotase